MTWSTRFIEKFWARVNKTETCWLWTGYTMRSGYGQVNTGKRVLYVHRVAWELVKGEPPPLGLDHPATCPKNCVNPDHLRLASQKYNMENILGPHRNSKSGVRGVVKVNNRWRVYVMHNRQNNHGGYYATKKEAELAAIALRNRLFTFNDTDRSDVISEADIQRHGYPHA